MARNKLAGKAPSYDKRNMSKESRDKKKVYDKKYHATTERKKYRAELNKKNRENHKSGKSKVGDKRDVSHTKKNGKTTLESQKQNRARNGSGKGGTRKSTKK